MLDLRFARSDGTKTDLIKERNTVLRDQSCPRRCHSSFFAFFLLRETCIYERATCFSNGLLVIRQIIHTVYVALFRR